MDPVPVERRCANIKHIVRNKRVSDQNGVSQA